jgi:hypothetical protein
MEIRCDVRKEGRYFEPLGDKLITAGRLSVLWNHIACF